jgi:hypothetical protein
MMNDYYDLLQQIQKKPGLYIGSSSISSLYMFLTGYQFARRQLSIPLSAQEREFREFQPWLQEKFGTTTSQSWSQLILFHAMDERDAFERFFALLEEFRRSYCVHSNINNVDPALEIG